MIYGAIAILFVILLAASNASASTSTGSGSESIQDMIRRVSRERGRDPALMLAIAKRESDFNPAAVNPSDPSYGMYQIQKFWLPYFGHEVDKEQLFDAEFCTNVACEIILYFELKGFKFPQQVDIYNVGETLWRDGRRNAAYRDAVNRFYSEFSNF
jgi:hypothetical protein